VCTHKKYSSDPVLYRGPDAAEHFLKNLLNEEARIANILSKVEGMNMTPTDVDNYNSSNQCYLCHKTLTLTKVRDHCHICGVYRGAACQKCNLNLKNPQYVPVFLHNLRNFDSFIIQEALGLFKNLKIKCIPRNLSKFVSFSLGNLRFLDSYQLMSCSLGSLTSNLAQKSVNIQKSFPNLCKTFTGEKQAQLLARKGIYSYEYVTDYSKFDERVLPAQCHFRSSLTGEGISDAEYEFAKSVWRELECETLGDFHDVYLLTDTLLLADCMEDF